MRKFQKLSLLICLLSALLLAQFPVHAAQTHVFLPLNMDAWVEHGESGSFLRIWVRNNTNTPIKRFLFRATLYDHNGQPAVHRENGAVPFYGTASNLYLQAQTNDSFVWSLNNYADVASVGNLQLTSVQFSGGRSWMYSAADNYSYEPDFSWENETMADGSIEMYYDHSVHLRDTSLGSLQREWYIWSDVENRWIWFSDEMETDCYIWARSACIKLVINHDPTLYQIRSFRVGMSPFMLMRHMDAADENTVLLDRYATDSERTFVQAEGNWNVAFWDENDFGQTRDWYIWDDAAQTWTHFSSERGPAYKVSQEGTYTVRLVYDGDSENALELSFTAARTAA